MEHAREYSVKGCHIKNARCTNIIKDASSHSYEYNVYTTMNLTTRP